MGGRISQVLVRNGYLTMGQVTIALEHQRASRKPLREVIVELGYISSAALDRLL
ncbi:MAG: hypothetical protein FJZ01_07905 [Candidatus Sericytochromatia bacterium]|nr:hypothetical protein [Candidatus Tanganyikabacteria bacterium]